ncbi:EAL domain-containing protein [Lyngbya confervoides]|uniref:EAL domain-containing protein n=1 Tax=Lyngbya confervoides BDU141951 TaxID=1574623 RepID=A0ABD4T6Q5_9CYAN|nr:EAL domain-containing protein [Lyngbya confervoides]MCM1984331.1 EAL domain-containing protein [Lyngbya confervoides BDU141951]
MTSRVFSSVQEPPLKVAGYPVWEKLYQSHKTQVWRAINLKTKKSIVVKYLNHPAASAQALFEFHQQFLIAQKLNHPKLLRAYDVLHQSQRLGIVLEDIGGISLADFLSSAALQRTSRLSLFFDLAFQLVQALEGLYEAQVIHHQLNPHNVLIHPQTFTLKVADFSQASLAVTEHYGAPSTPIPIRSDLRYLSPEQTGRMNCRVDYRADFYALGVIFYELITGVIPFQGTSPLELIHAHLARLPLAPHRINPEVPEALSLVVLRLLAKNAEERYQSPWGLRHDLEQCQQGWQRQGSVPIFALGQHDLSDRFLLPSKLYGRKSEVAMLLAAFERVSQGNCEMVMISGSAGIGKTAIVQSIRPSIAKAQGWFCQGKFDQLHQNTPFSAIKTALEELIEQILEEGVEELQKWRRRILKALGGQAQVMVEVFPELAKILGPQPMVPDLRGRENQNRFNLLFRQFIQVFSHSHRPLVLFLDDLQWADRSSLHVIQMLMGPSQAHQSLLLIGASRSVEQPGEVPKVQPLLTTLREQGIQVTQLTVQPLSPADLNQLVSETLHCTVQESLPLAQSLYRNTQGNPFYCLHRLRSLHRSGHIFLDREAGRWGYRRQDLALPPQADVTCLVSNQLQQLPQKTRQILGMAACLEQPFSLTLLARVAGVSLRQLLARLTPALREGLLILEHPQALPTVFMTPDSSALSPLQETILENHIESLTGIFLHDRIQQAAYGLLSTAEQPQTHLHIAQILLAQPPQDQPGSNVFSIANQLNLGSASIKTPDLRQQTIQINMQAAIKARKATAYSIALNYILKAIDLLPSEAWETHRSQTMDLYNSAAEIAYLSREFEQMEQWVQTILTHAQGILECVPGYDCQIQGYSAQNHLSNAIERGVSLLARLGLPLDSSPNPAVLQHCLQSVDQLAAHTKDQVEQLPEMTHPQDLAKLQIMARIFPIAFISASPITPILAMKMAESCLQQGNSSLAAFAYVAYGMVLCGMLGNIKQGYTFGQIALRLLARKDSAPIQGKVHLVFHLFIHHFQAHFRESLLPLQETYQLALAQGDFEYAAYAGHHFGELSLLAGEPLDSLEQSVRDYSAAIADLQQKTVLHYNNLLRQFVLNLLGRSHSATQLVGEAYDEGRMLPEHQAARDSMAIFYLHFKKLILAYLMGEFDQALHSGTQAIPHLKSVMGMAEFPLFHFYDSLGCLALLNSAPEVDLALLERVERNQQVLSTIAQSAPMNYRHAWHLVEAERCRYGKDIVQAIEHYDQAIAGALAQGFGQLAAMANELAGRFFLDWDKPKLARPYLMEAYYGYLRWGATAKVNHLVQTYPQFIQPAAEGNGGASWSSLGPDLPANLSDVLDYSSIVRACQVLSTEINLDRLVHQLLEIVIQNSGAQTGVLLLQAQEDWYPASVSRDGQAVSLTDPPNQVAQACPRSVLQAVEQSQVPLILENAAIDLKFREDPYIQAHCPKSILCLPIQQQGHLIGLLYLENSLSARAFRANHLEILDIICSQAAISLENARLYQERQSYTKELEASQAKLLEAHERLVHDAYHDSLTGLYNRAWFLERLSQVMQREHSSSTPGYAVLFLDLDLFKMVNDSLGHLLGDQLLKAVAQRIQDCLNPHSFLARLGGDEFAILVEHYTSLEEVEALAEQIQQQFKHPFCLDPYEIFTGTSIGIALGTPDYTNPNTVLRDADIALYRCKAKARGSYALFDVGMESSTAVRLQLANDLRRALETMHQPESCEFTLHYQPIVSLKGGQLTGFEALLRWNHPQRGEISPLKFIPVAEETGLIAVLGWWVFEVACQQLQQWRQDHAAAQSLSLNINVSPIQLQQPNLVSRIQDLLTHHRLPPDQLKLEITESCLIRSGVDHISLLKQLKTLGLHLCIDDFGTGYSSFSRLHEMPVSTLKIDRAFVRQIHRQGNGLALVQSIVTLARSLGVTAVAEGIETPDQLQALSQMDCELGQGFLLSKPVGAAVATEWVKNSTTQVWIPLPGAPDA